jgi:hypothetical protein
MQKERALVNILSINKEKKQLSILLKARPAQVLSKRDVARLGSRFGPLCLARNPDVF